MYLELTYRQAVIRSPEVGEGTAVSA